MSNAVSKSFQDALENKLWSWSCTGTAKETRRFPNALTFTSRLSEIFSSGSLWKQLQPHQDLVIPQSCHVITSVKCSLVSYQLSLVVIWWSSEIIESIWSQCSQKHSSKSLKQRRLQWSRGKEEAIVVSKASQNVTTVCKNKFGPIRNILEECPLDRWNKNQTVWSQ